MRDRCVYIAVVWNSTTASASTCAKCSSHECPPALVQLRPVSSHVCKLLDPAYTTHNNHNHLCHAFHDFTMTCSEQDMNSHQHHMAAHDSTGTWTTEQDCNEREHERTRMRHSLISLKTWTHATFCHAYAMQISPGDLPQKLVAFVADGASVMMGRLGGVQQKLTAYCPYLIRFHCAAHRSNLVGVRLGKNQLVKKMEKLLSGLYKYFQAHSAKKKSKLEIHANTLKHNLTALKKMSTVR